MKVTAFEVMSSSKCVCCGKTDESHKMVICNVCKKSFKIDCVDVSTAEARRIHSKSSGLTWSCTGCSKMGDDLCSLKAAIIALQDEIKVLKTVSQQPPPGPTLSAIDIEKIVQEVRDRENRRTNIIIYGAKEDAACQSSKEQVDRDVALVGELLVDAGLGNEEFRLLRLGKFTNATSERIRPIKVTFSSESCVSTIMRNVGSLKKRDRWRGVALSRNRTNLQREIYRKVRADFEERVSAGEVGLSIKYKQRVPTILSGN